MPGTFWNYSGERVEDRKAFIIAGICFVISIMLVSAYVSVRRNELTEAFGEEVDVVVAAEDIPEFATITPDMVKSDVKVFKAFKQPQTVADVEDVIGKSTYVSIAKGEQITLTKLVQQDGSPVLGRLVEKDSRALTVLISPQSGVGKLIRPGNRVDIMATVSFQTKGANVFEVKTALQNILVLATGRSIHNQVPPHVDREVLGYIKSEFESRKRQDFYGRNENIQRTRSTDNYSHMTLQVTPEQAESLLFLINNFGDKSLYFVLRNSGDSKDEKVATTILDDVLGPESDYGRSKRKPPPVVRKGPQFYDSVGGELRGVK